jgi:hypothetical protein
MFGQAQGLPKQYKAVNSKALLLLAKQFRPCRLGFFL